MKKSILEGRMNAVLAFADENKLYPNIPIILGSGSNPVVQIEGEKGEFLTFSTNNYLGLAMSDQIMDTIDKHLIDYGIGACATPVLGRLNIHDQLEKSLSQFTGYPAALTFSSASLASAGCIRALVDPFLGYRQPKMGESVILGDQLNHASIVDAVHLAKCHYIIYKHNDMKNLEHYLKKYQGFGILIVTDGVFSMDGDFADLLALMELAEKYDALLMVDDSHGFGVLGAGGRGTAEHFGVQPDILLSSFTKAVGSSGGFIAASETIIKYLRVIARTGIFSDPLPPAVCAGLCKTLEIFDSPAGADLRKTMHENADYVRASLRSLGFTIYGEETPIIPLIIGNEKLSMEFSAKLFARKIIATAIRAPAVPHRKERMRFSIMATHTREQLGHLISSCALIGKELEIIQ